ncbi:MAG: neutral zinc metallopeptidase [Miltoncostaeaceae bacterium]
MIFRSRTRTLATAGAVLALAAIPLTGCGGSDSSPSADTSAAAAAGSGADTAAVDTAATDDTSIIRYAGLRDQLTSLGAELNTFWKANLGDAGTWKDSVVKVVETASQTACGQIDAADTGPAYCDADATMVLPIAFFRDRLIGATDQGGNDAAVAAVVAHEFGHHVQALSGISEATSKAVEDNPDAANLMSVANELSADCLMGAWMSTARDEGRIEDGDIEEVLGALERIGDDRLTADAGQAADAATFNHGTSAQREYWFAQGYDTGDVEKCGVMYDDLVNGTLEKELKAGADAVNSSTTP